MTAQDVQTLNFVLPDAAATDRLGAWLAESLGPGDVLLLHGHIGAGKTQLARALIRHALARIDRYEDVPSPTFTLVQTYDAGETEIWHADLYRLSDVGEVIELGLDEAFATALCLIEWPDRLGPLTPPDALHLRLDHQDEGRLATLSGPAQRIRKLGLFHEQ